MDKMKKNWYHKDDDNLTFLPEGSINNLMTGLLTFESSWIILGAQLNNQISFFFKNINDEQQLYAKTIS